VKCSTPGLAILAFLSASLVLAEDFKTVNGKEYKNATVVRVESDGVVFRTKGGISKVYFIEMPREVQQRFGYDAVKLADQAAELQRQQQAAERERQEKEKNAEADLKQVLERFQAAEQHSAQTYQGATKGTLSGQIFVSAKGGENFKLGAVQVSLFARDALDVLIAGLKKYEDIKIQQLRPYVDAARAAYEQAESAEREAFKYHMHSISDSYYEHVWNEAKGASDTARDEYFKTQRQLNYYYSGDFYFSYLHSPIQTAETDGDGKFVLNVPKQGSFVLAAKGERYVGKTFIGEIGIDRTEHYYWLQPVSLGDQQQLIQNLSNNNLTSTTGTSSLIKTQD
jgi:hypothetical protein